MTHKKYEISVVIEADGGKAPQNGRVERALVAASGGLGTDHWLKSIIVETAERQRQEAECFRWLSEHPEIYYRFSKGVGLWVVWIETQLLSIAEGETLLAAILSFRQEAGK